MHLKSVTVNGPVLVEDGAVRFWIVPLQATMELTDPEEIAMALSTVAPYARRLFSADEAITRLRAGTDTV